MRLPLPKRFNGPVDPIHQGLHYILFIGDGGLQTPSLSHFMGLGIPSLGTYLIIFFSIKEGVEL